MSVERPPSWDFYRDRPADPPLRDRPTQATGVASQPKISGYRTLTDDEIAIINRVKAKAEEVRELLAWVGAVNDIDDRWFAIGRTDLQKGFMAVIRAVARPETF